LEIRNQKYAVVGVVPDYEADPEKGARGSEPLVVFLRAFASEEESRAWATSASIKGLESVDLACVCMYEWLCLGTALSDKVSKIYRDPLLQRLAENADAAQKEIDKALAENAAIKEIDLSATPEENAARAKAGAGDDSGPSFSVIAPSSEGAAAVTPKGSETVE
jgi:hypothetical protein